MDESLVQPIVNTSSTEPSLLDEMREHYTKTGEVRAEDVVRIFGDPREGVFMRGAEEPESPQHSIF